MSLVGPRELIAAVAILTEATEMPETEAADLTARMLNVVVPMIEQDERDRIADWMADHSYPPSAVRLIRERRY